MLTPLACHSHPLRLAGEVYRGVLLLLYEHPANLDQRMSKFVHPGVYTDLLDI